MSKILLDHWQSVELFCRIISKFEKKPLSEIKTYSGLIKFIRKASSLEYCQLVSSDIYNYEIKNSKQDKGSRVFYELSLSVRYREPYSGSGQIIQKLEEYIGDSDYSPMFQELKHWEPSRKKIDYEDTVWSLYTYDEQRIGTNGIKLIEPVILRGILKFKSFSKVEIENHSLRYNKIEKYIGTYNLYGEARYLLLDLKTYDSKEKNLRIELFIGSQGVVPLALGLYHNIDGAIYSGTVMVVNQVNTDESLEVKKFSINNDLNSPKLEQFIIDFFSDKNLNFLKVPAKLNNAIDVQSWLKEKHNRNNRKE